MLNISTAARFGIMVTLLFVGGTTNCSAEAEGNKSNRLGFSFDSQLHAAAAIPSTGGPVVGNSLSESPEGEILHLEKIIVEGKKVPFSSRDVLTPKGRLDLAKKTYLTPAYEKTFGPLGTLASYYFNPLGIFAGWHPNDAEALALYEDAAQKRRDTEMKELQAIAALADPAVRNLPKVKPPDRKKSGFVIRANGSATP